MVVVEMDDGFWYVLEVDSIRLASGLDVVE